MRHRVNGPPVHVSMEPPARKKKHGPFCQCPPPPLERRNMAQAIDTGGGGGRYPPPCLAQSEGWRLTGAVGGWWVRADPDVQMAKAKAQSKATWSGAELVCAAAQQGKTLKCGVMTMRL